VWARQEALDAAADAIENLFKTSETYTSISVDAAGNSLTLYATQKPADDLWNKARSQLPAAATLTFSESALSRTQGQVLTDYFNKRSEQGLPLARFGLDVASGGKYEVAFKAGATPRPVLSEADKQALNQFGTGKFEVTYTTAGAV